MALITRGGASVIEVKEYTGVTPIPEPITYLATTLESLGGDNLKVTGLMNFPIRKGDGIFFNNELKFIKDINFAHKIIVLNSAFAIPVPALTPLELVRSGIIIEIAIDSAGPYEVNGVTINQTEPWIRRHEEGLVPILLDASGTTVEVTTMA